MKPTCWPGRNVPASEGERTRLSTSIRELIGIRAGRSGSGRGVIHPRPRVGSQLSTRPLIVHLDERRSNPRHRHPASLWLELHELELAPVIVDERPESRLVSLGDLDPGWVLAEILELPLVEVDRLAVLARERGLDALPALVGVLVA